MTLDKMNENFTAGISFEHEFELLKFKAEIKYLA